MSDNITMTFHEYIVSRKKGPKCFL